MNPSANRSHFFYITLLLAVWVIMLLIVNPIGSFPLNDDWVYAKAVKYLLTTGQYHLVDNSSSNLISQALWGALFCLPAGFSFTTLRISCLVLGFTASIVYYFFACFVSGNRKISFLTALLLASNPMYFSLSNTFMTDIPFLCFAIISILFFYKTFGYDNYLYLLAATLFSVFATLTRQVGIVIPLAYGITLLGIPGNKIIRKLKAFIPFLITFCALYGYLLWMKNANPRFDPYQGAPGVLFYLKDLPDYLSRFFYRMGYFLYYNGFFLLPVLLFSAPAAFASVSRRSKKNIIACMAFAILLLICAWRKMPVGNILNASGIGPQTLRDVYILGINRVITVPPAIMHVVFALGAIGALLVVVNYAVAFREVIVMYKQRRTSVHSQLTMFLLLIVVGYSLLASMLLSFFDRYLLPTFVVTLLISITFTSTRRVVTPVRYFSITVACVIAAFSALATHDYLAWNRARWQAFNYLTEECKISPGKIDAGYECNGWCFNNYKVSAPGKSYWFVDDDEYIIAFGEIDGYKVLKTISYPEYLLFKQGSIYILKRIETTY